MENLFLINTESLEKTATATVVLPSDPAVWKKTIITEFLTDFPTLQNEIIQVAWKKKAFSKGYAVGALKVIGGNVPLIIQDYRLSPMDIIMFGSRALPLTAETLAELQTSPSPFKGTVFTKPKKSLDMFGDDAINWSPDGRQISHQSGSASSYTRDAVKVGSFIDRIEHIDKDDVKTLLKPIADDPTIYERFQKNGTTSVLEKLASRNLISKETILDTFLRNVTIDRQFMYGDEDGNMWVKQANSGINWVWETQITPEEMKTLDTRVAHSNIEKVADEAESVTQTLSTLKPGTSGKFMLNEKATPDVTILAVHPMKPLEKFAFLKYIPYEDKLFVIDEFNKYAIINNPTQRSLEKTASTIELQTSEPMIDDYGVWVQGDKVLTNPFTITRLQKSADGYGNYSVRGVDGLNEATEYNLTKMAFDAIDHENLSNNIVHLPADAKFIKLSDAMVLDSGLEQKFLYLAKYAQVDERVSAVIDVSVDFEKVSYYVSDDTEEIIDTLPAKSFIIPNKSYFINETLVEKRANGPVKNFVDEIGVDQAGFYFVRGNVLTKYASAPNNLKAADAIWAAIHCGASTEDLTKIAELTPGTSYYITNKLTLPVEVNRFDKIAEQEYDEITKSGKALTKYLLKEASVMADTRTVDAVLSLGLMKKHNIMEYVPFITDYERILGELAKLLVITRLGMSQIPEAALEEVLVSLNQVIFALKRVKASLSKVK